MSRAAWRRSHRFSAPAPTCSASDGNGEAIQRTRGQEARRERTTPDLRSPVKLRVMTGMKRVRREALNALLIVLGILSAAMGLKGFLLSSNFIDGGVTGVSMLLAKMTRRAAVGLAAAGQRAVRRVGYRQMGARVRGAQRAGDRRPGRRRWRSMHVPGRHAGSAADGGLRRLLHRRRHRPGGPRRRGARRHRNRRAADQQAQPTC